MAFIVMMHLAPDKPSMLPELLEKISAVPVSMANDGQSLVPARVYIVPPGTEISMPLLVLDEEKHADIANTALEHLLHLPASEIEGRDVFDLLSGAQDSDLDSKLEAALQGGQDFESRAFQLKTRQGENTYFVQGSIVREEQEQRPYRILLTLQRPEDV